MGLFDELDAQYSGPASSGGDLFGDLDKTYNPTAAQLAARVGVRGSRAVAAGVQSAGTMIPGLVETASAAAAPLLDPLVLGGEGVPVQIPGLGWARNAARAIRGEAVDPFRSDDTLLIRDLLPENPLRRTREGAKEMRKAAEATTERIAGSQDGAGRVERGVLAGAQSFGAMLPGMAATIATGNPSFVLGTGSAQSGSDAATKALDAGKTPYQAINYGAQDALAEFATEKIPVGRLLKDLKAGAPFLKTLGHQIATETPTEIVATAWQNFNEWQNLNPGKSVEDFAREQPGAAADTVIATITQSVLTAGLGTGLNRAANGPAKRGPELDEKALAELVAQRKQAGAPVDGATGESPHVRPSAASAEMALESRAQRGSDDAGSTPDSGVLDDGAGLAGGSTSTGQPESGGSEDLASGSTGDQQAQAPAVARSLNWFSFLKERGVSPAAIRKGTPEFTKLKSEYDARKATPQAAIADAAQSIDTGEAPGIADARDQIAQSGAVSAVQMSQDLGISNAEAQDRIAQITGRPAIETLGSPAQAVESADGRMLIAPEPTELERMDARVAELEARVMQRQERRTAQAALTPVVEVLPHELSQPVAGTTQGDWESFAPESGTLGIPRSEMPQIRAEHRGAMVNFLNARGVTHAEEILPATSLKPTQAEFSPEKVSKSGEQTEGERSILVSSDGHVLDGHHQWLAALQDGKDVKAIRLGAPIRDLVTLAHEFPSSTTDVSESGSAPSAENVRAEGPRVERFDREQNVRPVAEEGATPIPGRPLSVGVTPGGAEVVSVREGVVHIGEYPVQDFDSGEDVRVPEGATRADVAKALRDAGALSSRQKIFGIDETRMARGADENLPAQGRPSRTFKVADAELRLAPVTTEDVWSAITPVLRSAQNLPPVIVLQSPKQLREGDERQRQLYAWLRSRAALGDVAGTMHGRRIYLFAENIRSVDEARAVLLHEGAHYGLRGLMDEDTLNSLMGQVRQSNPWIADQAERHANRYGTGITEATEEVLANWAGRNDMADLRGWPKIVATVREWLRGLGFVREWTNADVVRLLQRAQQYWMRPSSNGYDNLVRRGARMARATGQRYSDEELEFFRSQGIEIENERIDNETESKNVGRAADGRDSADRKSAAVALGLREYSTGGKRYATLSRGSADGRTRVEDFGRVGEATGHPSAVLGVWFSSEPADAERYGKAGISGVAIENPAVFTAEDWPNFDTPEEWLRFKREQQDKGHDSLAIDYRGIGGPVHVVAFYPEQLAPVPALTSPSEIATIEVDGTERPILNSNGRPIAPTEAGVRNFWRWFDAAGREEGGGLGLGRVGGYGGEGRGVRVSGDNVAPGDSTVGMEAVHPGSEGTPDGSSGANDRSGPVFGGRAQPGEGDLPRYVLDASGRPRVFYHGTRDDFSSFDTDHANRKDAGWLGRGVYLTSDDFIAETYARQKRGESAPNVMPLYAAVKNPKVVSSDLKPILSQASQDAIDSWTDQAKADGHDGVVLEFQDGTIELVAFSPEQVKSATGNNGDFNPADSDIRMARSGQYSPEQEEFRRKAGIGNRPTLRQKIERWFSEVRSGLSWDAFRQGALDQFHGIRLAEMRTVGMLPVEQSAYVTARLATGASSVMAAILNHGQARWAANGQHLEKIPGTKGLLDVLKPVEGRLDDWLGWMVANRAQRLLREGRENNFTQTDISAGLDLAKGREAEFKAVAKEFAEFKRSVLDVAEQAGLIDPAGRQLWDHADWIPFYRQMADDTTKAPGGKRGLSKQTSGIRQLKGGESAINDPLENILLNFQHLIDASLKNNALRKVISNVEQGANSDTLLESVGYGMQGVMVPRAQIEKQLLAAGVTPQQIAAMPAQAFEGLGKMWALHAPQGADVIRVMEEGKPHFYRVTDPLLLRAVTSFEPLNVPGLTYMRMMKRLLTRTVTATPAFMARNFIRDSMSTAMISRDRTAVLGAMRGALKSLNEEGGFETMMFAGASFAGGQADGADPEATAKAMRRALRSKGFSTASADAFLATVIDSPVKAWDAYSKIGEAIENANREAIFEATHRAGNSETAAAFEALDLMDFRLRGSSALYQFFADITPFLNARVQGLYRLGRSDMKQVAVRGGLMLMLPSILLALANAGEDDYEELPDWDKDTYWHFFVGGHHFRLPKPFEVGVLFGTLPERITRAGVGDDSPKKLASRAWFNIADQFNLVQWPQFMRPAIEVWKNEDGFSGRAIENQGDEGKLPSMRYSYYTSDTMKALAGLAPAASDATGLSPKRLQHLWNGYLGSVGSAALGLADMGVRRFQGVPFREAMRLDEYPLLGVFYRESPAKNSQYVEDIYKMAAEASELKRSMDAARKEGNRERVEQIRAGNEEKIAMERRMRAAAKSMTAAGKQIERIRKDENLTSDVKREKIDEVLERRNTRAADIAKKGIEAWGGSI